MSEKKKYVVLEHLCMPNKGMRFYTTNSDNNTHSHKGDLWYKEVLFSDDDSENGEIRKAIREQTFPTMRELEEYYRNNKD